MHQNNDIIKNTTIELSIDPDGYITNWGVWEGAREPIQNCLDEHDDGHTANIRYNQGKKKLTIENAGVILERQTLRMGASSKSDDPRKRGRHGVGYKDAIIVLMRLGKNVTIYTGDEKWVPGVEYSKKMQANVMKVQIRKLPNDSGNVRFVIDNITPDEWEMIRSRVHFLDRPKNYHSFNNTDGTYDKILLDEKFRGKLYCKGLFVRTLQNEHKFGYDISDLQLDRDRNSPDYYELSLKIATLFSSALNKGIFSAQDVLDILESEFTEKEYIVDSYSSRELTTAIVDDFFKKYGQDAFPVTSSKESLSLTHEGLKPIEVNSYVHRILSRRISFDEKRKEQVRKEKNIYDQNGLPEDEFNLLVDIYGKISRCPSIEPFIGKYFFQIVDFYSDKIRGTFRDIGDGTYDINISKSILNSKHETLKVMVHELAHVFGPDGSVEHRDAIDSIYSEIIFQ